MIEKNPNTLVYFWDTEFKKNVQQTTYSAHLKAIALDVRKDLYTLSIVCTFIS